MTVQEFFTPAQLAERWQIDRSTVGRRIRSGRIKAVQFGDRCWRVPASEVARIDREGVAA